MLQWIQRKFTCKERASAQAFIVLAGVLSLFFIFSAHSLLAQSSVSNGVDVIQSSIGLTARDPRAIVATIIKYALGLLGIIVVVIIIYGGWLYMSSGGEEEKIGQAKKIIINAVIGLAIILLSYAMVLFVVRLLGIGGVNGSIDNTGNNEPVQVDVGNFSGSGALGGIIKDHYPTRGQIDVARNSKIIITFRKPVRLSSFIKNTNNSADKDNNPIFGDCLNVGASMQWEKDCDALILDDNHISIKRADNGQAISGAAVLATLDDGKAFTIVIRPYDYLGNSSEKVTYKVHLGSGLLLDEAGKNTALFGSGNNSFYEWQFTCSTVLDTQPPVITSVFPNNNATEAKNSIIQINFNKPMDPSGVQGDFKDAQNSYALQTGNILLRSGASKIPMGSFQITNGYQTLEFNTRQECGLNACGDKIYCLPVCDKSDASCTQDQYEIVLKAAQTFNTNSFESIPFSGVMDAAGNALDGNKNNKVDVVPANALAFSEQQQPDNFFWKFNLKNEIDNSAPYLERVSPGLDAENISANTPLTMLFSKRMRVDSLYQIAVQEKPAQATPLCFAPRAVFNNNNSTLVTMLHCPFVDTARHYYYSVVTSTVQDVHYNCFYPGKGPGGEGEVVQHLKQSSVCGANGENCCGTDAQGKSFCCNGVAGSQSTEECLKRLQSLSL